jgi:hypothetical protein
VRELRNKEKTKTFQNHSVFNGTIPPSLGIPDKSENRYQICLGYILGYILDTSKIYLGYRCIPDISQMYLGYIPNLSNIPKLSGIYPGFIPNDR